MRKCQPFFKWPVVVVCISTNPTKCSPVIGVNVAAQEARVSVSLWCPVGPEGVQCTFFEGSARCVVPDTNVFQYMVYIRSW